MSTLFSDDFNRADGPVGANYYYEFGSAGDVVDGRYAPTDFAEIQYTGSNPGANCWVSITVVESFGLQLQARVGGAGGGGYVRLAESGQIGVIDTHITSSGPQFSGQANGDTLRLEAHGSTLRVYNNGRCLAEWTNSDVLGAGGVFLQCYGFTLVDDFALGNLPSLSSPTPSGTLGTETTATVGCTTDEAAGTLYVVVDTVSLAGIGVNQIIDGERPDFKAAFKASSATVSSTTPSVAITGLIGGTTYNYALLHFSGGNSNIITGTFTTAAATVAKITGTSSVNPQHGAALTVTGVNFGASQGSQSVRIGGAVQPIQSWSATSIVVRAVDRGSNRYGTPVNVEVWSGGAAVSNSYALESLQPQTGWAYQNIGWLAPTAQRLTATADIGPGDQITYRTWVEAGQGLVAVANNASWSAPSWSGEFDIAVWTPSDGWGSVALQRIDLGQLRRLLEHLFDGGLFSTGPAAALQTEEAFGPAGLIKVWDGAAAVEKPIKHWAGSAWQQKPLKRWTGLAWINS